MTEKDFRLRDHWKQVSLNELLREPPPIGVVLVSYPDDEGVRNNHGRPGAKEGPSRILHFLSRLVLHKNCPPIYVLKDRLQKWDLSARHRQAEENLRAILEEGHRVVTIGGGHDYGYPDAAAYYEIHGGKLINIDAHLDVRPVEKAIGSGTPFRRFVERFGGRDLIEWGLQVQSNSPAHIAWAKSKKVSLYSSSSKWPRIKSKVGLSVCLDAFAGIRGVSAPALVGPSCKDGLELVAYYSKNSPWMGVYECAPKLDPVTEDSARYSAILIYHFIYKGKLYEGSIF